MKTLLLVLLLGAGSSAWSGSMEEADTLYESGRFAEAAALYRSACASDPSDPSAHYNLGNAYMRLGGPGDLGRAVAAYQRAFELDPRDADTRHNLDLALRRAGESLVPPGTPRVVFLAFRLLGRTELAALHAVALWALLLLASAALWKEAWRERFAPSLRAVATAWALAACWWAVRSLTEVADPAVVIAQEAEARSGPSQRNPVGFKVPEGRRVSVLSEREGWVEIGVLKEGIKGWLPAGQIERIRTI